jgi:hypothetical protein
MILERLLAWKALIESSVDTIPLGLEVWFDEETGSMDPLTIACSNPTFRSLGLRYDNELEVPTFYDLVGYDACSSFFQLTRSQTMFILDPIEYKTGSYDEVIDHIGHVINTIANQQKD